MGELCAAGVDMEAQNLREGLERVRGVLFWSGPEGTSRPSVGPFFQGATLTGDRQDGLFVLERLEDLQSKRQLANPEFVEVVRDARVRALNDKQFELGSRLLKLEDRLKGH